MKPIHHIALSVLLIIGLIPSSPYALMALVKAGIVQDIPGCVAFVTVYLFGGLYALTYYHAAAITKALGGR